MKKVRGKRRKKEKKKKKITKNSKSDRYQKKGFERGGDRVQKIKQPKSSKNIGPKMRSQLRDMGVMQYAYFKVDEETQISSNEYI